jgi:hypothetical protein
MLRVDTARNESHSRGFHFAQYQGSCLIDERHTGQIDNAFGRFHRAVPSGPEFLNKWSCQLALQDPLLTVLCFGGGNSQHQTCFSDVAICSRPAKHVSYSRI